MARPEGFKRHRPYVTKLGPFCGAKRRAATAPPGATCKLIAGYKTDHPGQGRCYLHGGRSKVQHGFYSKIEHNSLRKKLEDLGRIQTDVMDLKPEVQLLRALVIDYVNRYEAFVDALMAWYADSESGSKPRRILDLTDAERLISAVGKMVERINKIENEGAISMETFRRVTEQMGLIVAKYVADKKLLHHIELDWSDLAIDSKPVDHHAEIYGDAPTGRTRALTVRGHDPAHADEDTDLDDGAQDEEEWIDE